MSTFFCKYCGYKGSSISSMTGMKCSKSPTSTHIPYEGSLTYIEGGCGPMRGIFRSTSEFICKYCGRKAKTISSLTGNRCSKNVSDGANGSKYCVPL